GEGGGGGGGGPVGSRGEAGGRGGQSGGGPDAAHEVRGQVLTLLKRAGGRRSGLGGVEGPAGAGRAPAGPRRRLEHDDGARDFSGLHGAEELVDVLELAAAGGHLVRL